MKLYGLLLSAVFFLVSHGCSALPEGGGESGKDDSKLPKEDSIDASEDDRKEKPTPSPALSSQSAEPPPVLQFVGHDSQTQYKGQAYAASSRPTWKWKFRPDVNKGPVVVKVALDTDQFDNSPAGVSQNTFTPSDDLEPGWHVLYISVHLGDNVWSEIFESKIYVLPSSESIYKNGVQFHNVPSLVNLPFQKHVKVEFITGDHIIATKCKINDSPENDCKSGDEIPLPEHLFHPTGNLKLFIEGFDIIGRRYRYSSETFRYQRGSLTIIDEYADENKDFFVSFRWDTDHQEVNEACVTVSANYEPCNWVEFSSGQVITRSVRITSAREGQEVNFYLFIRDKDGALYNESPQTLKARFDSEVPDPPSNLSSITHPLNSVSTERNLILSFDPGTDESPIEHTCRIRGRAWEPCDSSKGFTKTLSHRHQTEDLPTQVTVDVRVKDVSGKENTSSYEFSLDLNAPLFEPMMLDRDSGSIVHGTTPYRKSTIRLGGIADEDDLASVCIVWSQAWTGTCETWYSKDDLILLEITKEPQSRVYFYVFGKDVYGNSTPRKYISIYYAGPHAPANITSTTHPDPNSIYSRSTAALTWDAGNLDQIDRYQCAVSNANDDTKIWQDCDSATEHVYDNLPDGTNVFHVRALLLSGEVSAEDSRLINIDTTGPQLSDLAILTEQRNGNYYADGSSVRLEYVSDEPVKKFCVGINAEETCYQSTYPLNGFFQFSYGSEMRDNLISYVKAEDAYGNSTRYELNATIIRNPVLPDSINVELYYAPSGDYYIKGRPNRDPANEVFHYETFERLYFNLKSPTFTAYTFKSFGFYGKKYAVNRVTLSNKGAHFNLPTFRTRSCVSHYGAHIPIDLSTDSRDFKIDGDDHSTGSDPSVIYNYRMEGDLLLKIEDRYGYTGTYRIGVDVSKDCDSYRAPNLYIGGEHYFRLYIPDLKVEMKLME